MKKIIEFQKEYNIDLTGELDDCTLTTLGCDLGLNNIQLVNFLGQMYVETGGFNSDTENLNYSESSLIKTFSYYKKNPFEASLDGRTKNHKADQETIANKVYWDVNRSKNYKLGNENWGDGWKYRGRGSIMTTGKWNYESFSKFVNEDLTIHPELVATKYYWQSGIFFFNNNNLWQYCNDITIDSITTLTKRVNGGTHGLDERIKRTLEYAEIMGLIENK